ncbi:MAG: DUF3798 domain-containing protein [Bacillota bacterium]
MVKRLVLAALVLTLVGSLSASSMASFDYRIGVVTGTVSQNEDEYRGAEAIIRKYPGLIIHRTYPDNFMQEQETYIAQIAALAADPKIKAIVVNQGVPGTVAAIRKVKETRPDMVFVVGQPHDDQRIVEKTADVALRLHDTERGYSIVRLAHKMGAKKFIHYSFPRHMSYEHLAKRRDIMKAECEKLGMEFIFVTAPDPMGEGGLPAAQQFILEDVPRQVAKHGKETAFFSTNCGMQEPLIRAVLEQGALFPEQCCPSPTHGYPGALGLKITDDIKGNFPAIMKAIEAEIVKRGMAGRFATWPVATSYLNSTAGVEIAKQIVEKKLNPKDIDTIKKVVEVEAGYKVQFSRLSDQGNFYLYVVDSHIFGGK